MSSNETDTRTRILEATWQLLEESPGRDVSMSEIARAVGISRQALYLHFASRTELLIATTHYVDEVKGLNERLAIFKSAGNGIEMLDACVEVWGNYIPEIYGIARALLRARDTDEAAAAAWNDSMACLHDVCREIIETLDKEGNLAPVWTRKNAVQMLWTLLSIHNWEQLTMECGWSKTRYVNGMRNLLKNSFVVNEVQD